MHVLNQFFDKIYCINLDHRTDRWEECIEMFNHYGLDVERVSPFPPDEEPICCITKADLSLIKTAKKIIEVSKQNNYKNVLILEDDVEFCDYLKDYTGESIEKRFNDNINFLPEDWDVLYLGSGIDTGNKSLISGEMYKVGFAHTTHAVGISSKFFDVIISYFENPQEAIDIIYSRLMGEYKMYSFFPNLMSQRPSFSDIQKINVNYGHLRNYYDLNK